MEKLPTSELLPTQLELKSLCDVIHAIRLGGYASTFLGVPLKADAVALEGNLKVQSFGHLLLQDGESFSIEDPTGYYRDLGVVAGAVRPIQASATAWVWDERAYGRDNDEWSCELELRLWYTEHLSQSVSAHTSSHHPDVPSLSRRLSASEYFETGYEGHGHKYTNDLPPEAIDQFLAVVTPLVRESVEIIEASDNS